MDDRLDVFGAAARAGVAEYLRNSGAGQRFPGLSHRVRIDSAESTVVVEVSANLDLPLSFPGTPTRARIGATGSAIVRTDREP